MNGSPESSENRPPLRCSSFMIDSILKTSSGDQQEQPMIVENVPEDQMLKILKIMAKAQTSAEEAVGQDSEVQEQDDDEDEEDLKRTKKNFEWFSKRYDYDNEGKSGLDVLADCVHQMDMGVPEVEIPSGYVLHRRQHTDHKISAREAWNKLPKDEKQMWNRKSKELFHEEWKLGKVRKVPVGGMAKKKRLMKGKYLTI